MATTMTEIPIKDLALTTAPAGKQLLVRDASAGLQRIDYDQIAKNLVESYGSSSLAGKNQTIKAAIDSLNSGLTQNTSSISTINDSLSNIKKPYHLAACYGTIGEDQQMSGEIPFNNFIRNDGNCQNSSSHRFICPVNGLYLVTQTYYSNDPKFDNTLRPSIFVNGSMQLMTDVQPVNLSAVMYCSKNDGISAGCYQGRINFYSARGHNLFTVTLLKEM